MSAQRDKTPVNGKTISTRQALYKNSGHDWKEIYRKRCLKRLRESRTEMFARRRGVERETAQSDGAGEAERDGFIERLMSSELQALKNEQAMDCEMELFDSSIGEIDLTLSLIEEIQEEMKAEEAKLMAEYDLFQESLEQEEAALCSAIEMLHTHPICPVCAKHTLMENKGIIFCKCGVRINTEQDGIGLDYLQRQLDDAKERHQCDEPPVFTVKDTVGISNLIMLCQACDFIYIVI